MSVINKMLKDLDKRQQPHNIESMATPQLAYKANSTSKRALVITSLVSLVIGGFVAFWATGVLQSETEINIKQVSVQPPAAMSDVKESVDEPKDDSPLVNTDVEPQEQANVQLGTQELDAATPVIAKVTAVTKEPKVAPQQDAKLSASAVTTELIKPATKPATTLAATAATKPKTETVTTEVTKPKPQVPVSLVAQMNIAPASQPQKALHRSGNMAVTEVKLSPEALAQKQMLLATDAQQQGLHLDALTYYEAALMYNPALHQARRQAAALYYGQNKLAQAAKLLEQGQLLFPQEYEFSLLLARVLQAGGQNEQALKSLALIPDSSDLAIKKWHQQSDLAQKQKDYPVAEQSFRQLAKSEPYQGRWWMGLGYALDAQQQYTEAKLAYNQALSQGNLSAQAKVYVDNRLLQLGAY